MSNFLFYVAAFALVLGVLIIAHEYGHYFVARCAGVKVLRFSVGFGRVVWSKRMGRDGTEWAIGLFPLGGYVKMLDEREGPVAPGELPRSFNRQSVWRRMAIVAAGPLANLVLAIVVYWGLFLYGTEEPRPILGAPSLASPAAAAGFENGERVLKVGGEPVQTWQEMRWVVLRRAVEQPAIDFEVINARSEIAVRRLDVSSVSGGGWDGDPLERLGIGFFRPRIPAVIGKVSDGGPAAVAGLSPGDEVLQIDGEAVSAWSDVVRRVRAAPGKPLEFEVRRNAQRYLMTVTPAVVDDQEGLIGRIGTVVKDPGFSRGELTIMVRYGPLAAFGKAVGETWDKSVFSLVMMEKMIAGEISWRNISGPVTIADYAGRSAKLGLDYYLKFLALVSISLAVLNLLPIPILDGGHLLYYVVEIIKRGPLSERSMEIGQQIGLALMLMLMACAFYNDINRLISG
jgi:regulator of sigma E protease